MFVIAVGAKGFRYLKKHSSSVVFGFPCLLSTDTLCLLPFSCQTLMPHWSPSGMGERYAGWESLCNPMIKSELFVGRAVRLNCS
jgi:hypothetical protein